MTALTRLLLAAPALLAFSTAGSAQTPPSRHLGAIGACRSITDDAARLKCFDREAAALVAASQNGQISIVDRGDVRAVRRSLFGFSLPRLGLFDRENEAEQDEVKEVMSEVVRAVSIGGGKFRVVIADQKAVWETTEATVTGLLPRPGDKVHIKKGALGGYFIRLGSQTWVKGRRVG